MWVDPYTTKAIVADQLEAQKNADQVRQEYGLTQQDTANAASVGDRFDTAYDLQQFQSKYSYEDKVNDKIKQNLGEYLKYKDNGLQTLLDKAGPTAILGTANTEGTIDWYKGKTSEIEELRAQHPEANIQTYDEIQKGLAKEYLDLSVKDQVQTDNRTWGNMLGFAAGSISGYMTDPVNAFTSVLPTAELASAGAGLAKLAVSAGKFAAQEQVVSAYQFLQNEPTSVDIRQRATGQTVTPEEQTKEFLMQQALTGVASLVAPAAVGLYRAGKSISGRYMDIPDTQLNKDLGPVTKDLQDKLNNTNMPPEEKAVIQDTVDLAKTTPEGLDQAQHARNYEEAQKAFSTGQELNVPYSRPEAPTNTAAPVVKDISEQQAITNDVFKPSTIDDVIKEKYNKMDSYLSTLDQNERIPGRVEDDGTISEYSDIAGLRQKLKDMSDNTNAVDAVYECWIGGGPKGA